MAQKYRWLWLLLASCFFYMFFKPEYILILFFTIVIDFFVGIKIESCTDQKSRKAWLIASIIANIGVLAIFKYYNFINENITGLAQLFHLKNPIPALTILLPIGLSFHTFQAMSYTIEVYRGNQKAERHFGIYSLYVMFFPQLVAGPIERPQNIIHQLKAEHKATYENLRDGSKWILWGLFKKICIADRLAFFVNEVYNNPGEHNGFQSLIAVIFFSFQIYCDFSAYSDIAIGTAKMLGIDLMKNFNRPYASNSIAIFWTRWHISLSSWFKDYLYIPLGGNRNKWYITYRNILIVFLLSGLWHGASWTFLIWGLLHGLAMIVESIWMKIKTKIWTEKNNNQVSFISNQISIVCIFIFVTFAWIFFRAKNFADVKQVLVNIRHLHIVDFSFTAFGKYTSFDFKLAILLLIFLELIQYLTRDKDVVTMSSSLKSPIRWAIYIILTFFILFFGAFHQSKEFIYFQF